MLGLYILICICWGAFSVYMQTELYPEKSHPLDLTLNFVVNSVIAPISMVWALICWLTKTGWAKGK